MGKPLDARAVAKALGVHKDTALEYLRAGKIEAWRLPGGHWRVEEEALEGFKQAQTVAVEE